MGASSVLRADERKDWSWLFNEVPELQRIQIGGEGEMSRKEKKPRLDTKEECEKLEYAVTLIETMNKDEDSPIRVVEVALTILEFGNLTPKQMLDYIDATGR